MVTMPAQAWVFRARCERVVDGDTIDVRIDAGFHAEHIERLRLLGVNAPEMHGASADAGSAAKAWVEQWLAAMVGTWPLVVQTHKTDAFGRYLAVVWRADTAACLNDELLAAGMAVPFGA